jgi:hypothetical protein
VAALKYGKNQTHAKLLNSPFICFSKRRKSDGFGHARPYHATVIPDMGGASPVDASHARADRSRNEGTDKSYSVDQFHPLDPSVASRSDPSPDHHGGQEKARLVTSSIVVHREMSCRAQPDISVRGALQKKKRRIRWNYKNPNC